MTLQTYGLDDRSLTRALIDIIIRYELLVEHLLEETAPLREFGTLSIQVIRKARIKKALDMTDWNISKAARVLGISRSVLYVTIRRYKLKPDSPEKGRRYKPKPDEFEV